ncbi:MAG: PfkB family carbohydrate kinase [Lachnospiraceae bacterium]|nr:PfkB family carbohydrate kinase [Lachnospiraceae bacterium]
MREETVRFLGIGDNVSDQYVHTNTMYPGGQALNVASFAAMQGADVGFLGAFGSDAPAEHIQSVLCELGVDMTRCRHFPGENGAARVTLEDGDRVFLGSNKGGVLRLHPLQLDEEDLAYICGYHIAHTSNNSYLDTELKKIKETGILLSYDFSLTWRDPVRRDRVSGLADLVFLSCSELDDGEVRELLRMICRQGTGVAVATRGARGALLCDGTHFYEQPSEYVEPLDTMGAGDAFASAFLFHLVPAWREHGATPEPEAIREAASAAAHFSSQICLQSGAFGHGQPIPEGYEPTIIKN